MLGSLALSGTAISAEGEWFNPAALSSLEGTQAVADLSAFNDGTQPPGKYRTDIYVNGDYIETSNVTFVSRDNTLVPEFTTGYWMSLGLKPEASAELTAMPADSVITDPASYISGITTSFDYNITRLDISIPQAVLRFRARDFVDPALRDNGIPAAMVNYNLNYNNNWRNEADSDYSNLFLRLDSGLNLGGWRLRNNSSFTRNTGQQPYYDENGRRIVREKTVNDWRSMNTYAFHDIAPWDARLTLGDSSTPGDLFDSIQYRGIQLTSDDSMLPDSLRGFAPVVRGIARSNATVTVRQNGTVIYTTSVAPGPFEIRDIYPTASSGTLDITVKEANGSQTNFVQPFSAVPGMQREGRLRFSLTGGKYRAWSDSVREPGFLQGTLQYGILDGTTVYGGAIAAQDYKSAMLGAGQGLGRFGSLSLDVTHANTQLDGGPARSGQSVRAQYNKDILQSGTSFVLAGYRYSTSGYYDFTEAAQRLPQGTTFDEDDPFDYWRRTHNKRNRLQAQVSQQLGDYGSLSFTAYQQDYWGESGSERTMSLGYSFEFSNLYFNISLNDSRYPQFEADRSVYASVSIPLSNWLSNSRATYSAYHDNEGRSRHQVGLSGQALEDRSLNWNVQEGWANKGEGNSGSAYASWNAPLANLNASYSYDGNGRQASAGMSGSVIAHPYGVTLAQSLGNTAALVRAPEAGGVSVLNQTGVKTDWRGYTATPYITPYRRNNVSIDTMSLPDNVDIEQTSQVVIPTYGALVLADFKPTVGARVLATLRHNGKPVPFGAMATLMSGQSDEVVSNSIVGSEGEVYLSGVKGTSRVKVSWGKESGQQCEAPVTLKKQDEGARLRMAELNCR
ncbi:fimbria/pilus outer membrane usher protein [Pantoea endophytica]|uniref:Fimbria/pilus outer membrane usher protein n=1 Tax=Pantoea sp. BJ2 TaxID=3141322 RepID=A0AAU7U392_9GAMM